MRVFVFKTEHKEKLVWKCLHCLKWMNYLCIVVEKYFKVKYFEFSTVGITKGYLDKQMRDNIAQIFSLTSISLQINAALFPLPSATVLTQIKKKAALQWVPPSYTRRACNWGACMKFNHNLTVFKVTWIWKKYTKNKQWKWLVSLEYVKNDQTLKRHLF